MTAPVTPERRNGRGDAEEGLVRLFKSRTLSARQGCLEAKIEADLRCERSTTQQPLLLNSYFSQAGMLCVHSEPHL